MVRLFICLLLFWPMIIEPAPVIAQNPFLSNKTPDRVAPSHARQKSFLTKIAQQQQQLKQKMAASVRLVKTEGSISSLITVLIIAFGYGILHAAGPGHGKAVAMSYILSRDASIGSGLLFSTLVAFSHGFSGVICVLGLHYVLQKSVSGTLATVSQVTQIVSFGLITLLGFGILVKKGYQLFSKSKSSPTPLNKDSITFKKNPWPWAVVVGLVPCPGVVMVMLFCFSMDVPALGLLLAACISLGMAVTISLVVTIVVMGKTSALQMVSKKGAETIEGLIGLLSGALIAVLGMLFLLTAINPPVH